MSVFVLLRQGVDYNEVLAVAPTAELAAEKSPLGHKKRAVLVEKFLVRASAGHDYAIQEVEYFDGQRKHDPFREVDCVEYSTDSVAVGTINIGIEKSDLRFDNPHSFKMGETVTLRCLSGKCLAWTVRGGRVRIYTMLEGDNVIDSVEEQTTR